MKGRTSRVFRRGYTEDGGRPDEAFTRKLRWEYGTLLTSAERGGPQDEFIEITEDEANQIVEQIRAKVTGAKRSAAHQAQPPAIGAAHW